MSIPPHACTPGPYRESVPDRGTAPSGSRRPAGAWRARALAGGLVALIAVALILPVGAETRPLRGIFEVMVLARPGALAQGPRRWVDFREGTGFFIGTNGIALTNSHVVFPAREYPKTYELLAVWNGEFYGATVLCASQLPPAVLGNADMAVEPQRDLAEIHLIPPHFQFNVLKRSGVLYAVAHPGPLPTFPSLAAGPDPRVGDSVRVVSYGDFGTLFPHEQQNDGRVSGFDKARDGTRLVAMRLGTDPEPGASGSPVINVHNQVVGVFAWGFRNSGLAMTRRALDPICR